MIPSTATYKSALHRPHKRRTIVDIYDALGNALALDVPFSTGLVRASLISRVTRHASLTLSEEWFPDEPTDPASPTQAVLRIRSGIEYADGSDETFPIFRGRVANVALNGDGSVTLEADDQAADVVGFRFESPRNANRPTLIDQAQALIAEAVPGAMFGPHDVADAPTPQLTWDEDRGQALDDIAEALGARWYQLGNGSFVLRSFPYDNGTVVQELLDGEEGLLSRASLVRSRDGSANSVTVVSERADGTDPVRVTARNTVSGSPTQFGDRYGRVSQIIKIQTPLTGSEAQRLAIAQLNASTALTEQWSVEACVPDHTLEPGDPVRLRYRGREAVQVIDSITYPLDTGPMSLITRAFFPAPISLS